MTPGEVLRLSDVERVIKRRSESATEARAAYEATGDYASAACCDARVSQCQILLSEIRALPRATMTDRVARLWGALDEAYEAIGAARAVLPVVKNPSSDLQRLVNLASGLLDIPRIAITEQEAPQRLWEDCPSERQEHCELAPEGCECRRAAISLAEQEEDNG